MASKRKTRRSKRAPKVRSFSAAEFRHKAFTLAEQVRALSQFMSLSQLSRETGIPRTTLRRYRDGGKPAKEIGELYAGILQTGFDVIHKESAREEARSRSVDAIGKAVRVKRIDPRDPARKKKIASDSVDRAAINSSDQAILRTLRRAARRARVLGVPGIVRFLLLAGTGDHSNPDGYVWSEPEALAELTDEEIADVLAEARHRGDLIIVRIQDREK